MGLKKRSKVSAEFSMSSLTDIIFLLLIFFMLTSSLVSPNALNLKLPGSSTSKMPTTTNIDDVKITKGGTYYLNGKATSIEQLDSQLNRMARSKSGQLSITISPAKDTPVEDVIAVMDIAMRYNINGILATSLN